MHKLTVFTPTYNREKALEKCYESLCKQLCKDFEWLVIDDGSTDNTRELVARWMAAEDNGFPIRYIYKENGGLHTAYNTAIANLASELAVCIDSDDYMPPNAVELIRDKWEKDGSDQYAGIIGLDYDTNGNLIGGLLPEQNDLNLIDVASGKQALEDGDKKIVVRSDLYRIVAPMKVFPGEKYFNPHYMHLEISRNYNFLVLNQEICTVDYQPDGMTANMFRQYYNSPNSFLEIRKQFFTFPDIPFKKKVRNMIHLVSSSLLAGKYGREWKTIRYKGLMLFCTPPGILLAALTWIKGR